ncbi:hypothetical protein GGR51DRAFT_229562 [Nemania sp. FL0031]|nr:hypothetical protein GGR51DRAFT_229562 [Nemania sp. FL0031]
MKGLRMRALTKSSMHYRNCSLRSRVIPSSKIATGLVNALWMRTLARSGLTILEIGGFSRAHDTCRGRALFATRDRHLGIAPASVAEGDEICLLFGCPKPIVLRPVATGTMLRYKVVGECYLDNMMLGQALLGQLPEHLHGLLNPQSGRGGLDAGFIDIRTNTVIQEDPRIEPFLAGLVSKGLLTNPSVEELGRRDVGDILIRAGHPVKLFDLI